MPKSPIAALKAGKHVFCEKPIALRPADAVRMVKTAKAAGKQLMIGQVLPFFPEYAFAYRIVRGGKLGALLGGHFKRVISDPLWLKDFYDPHKVGGPMLDLHVHDAHYIRLLFGMPRRYSAEAACAARWPSISRRSICSTTRDWSSARESGVIQQQGRAFSAGFEIALGTRHAVVRFRGDRRQARGEHAALRCCPPTAASIAPP